MPPPPPKLPNFSIAGTSAIKNDGPKMSNPVARAPPVTPPMPSKMPSSYKKPSMGLSNAALTAGRGGLRPVQSPNSNSRTTQATTESERSPNPIKAADLMANKKKLRPVPQMTKPPVVMPKQATNREGSGVASLVRRFDKIVR